MTPFGINQNFSEMISVENIIYPVAKTFFILHCAQQ